MLYCPAKPDSLLGINCWLMSTLDPRLNAPPLSLCRSIRKTLSGGVETLEAKALGEGGDRAAWSCKQQ